MLRVNASRSSHSSSSRTKAAPETSRAAPMARVRRHEYIHIHHHHHRAELLPHTLSACRPTLIENRPFSVVRGIPNAAYIRSSNILGYPSSPLGPRVRILLNDDPAHNARCLQTPRFPSSGPVPSSCMGAALDGSRLDPQPRQRGP